MSLDLSLVNPDGEIVFDRNITHNLIPIWQHAAVYGAFYLSEGHKANEYKNALRYGLISMVENFSEFKRLEAKYGWGTAEQALAWLFEAYRAFAAYPDATVRVCQ